MVTWLTGLGHEKLNVEMQRTYGNRMVVLKIPKSGGVRTLFCNSPFPMRLRCSLGVIQVVELDTAYRERVHQYQLHTYFYGHVLEPPAGNKFESIF